MKSLNLLFSKIQDFVYSLGYFGENIMILITCALIYNNPFYLFFYFFFLIINRILNQKLKNIIKEDRPNNPLKFLDKDTFNTKIYGNPSGHTQSAFFSFLYSYLVVGKLTNLLLFSFLICIITIYQRYTFNNHTLSQLIMGIIVGLIVAYLSYSITTYIKNKLYK